MESNLPIGRTSGKMADNGRGRNGTIRERFRHLSAATATAVGSPWAVTWAAVTIIAWAITGPIFHYSDTWQLVVNTATTIVTFLMVFLIQSTQNRDARAIHLKLDELIRGVHGARTAMVALENATDEELADLQAEFERLHRRLSARHPGEPAGERRGSV